MSQTLFNAHRATLDGALSAIASRAYWSPYPEVPSGKVYGEAARQEGEAAFKARLGRRFEIDQPGTKGWVGSEKSPWGLDLGVTYPDADLDALLATAGRAGHAWARAGIEARIGVCLEILHRLNRRSFEVALAVMHTTGQAFMMAFQAGGPHAQDRGLEAVAWAWREMTHAPASARWTKPVSKSATVTLDKSFRVVPRGVAAVVGCSTFPTWNGYPGFFASLATGNAVVVKPHPGAVLPLAITVEIARQVLREHGHDPDAVTLAADTHGSPVTRELVTRPDVKIIDYTGGSEFGSWIERHAPQAVVFTEKAGVNPVVIDSVADLAAAAQNIAFGICLYSGQMCTRSQNIFVPRGGIDAGVSRVGAEEVASAIVRAIDGLLADTPRAVEVLGCVQNEATLERARRAADGGGRVLRPPADVPDDANPGARHLSPAVILADAREPGVFMREMFGPVAYVVLADSTEHALELAAESARRLGAITCAVYSTRQDVIDRAIDLAADAGMSLSVNLTGPVHVNQAAAFSDFHVSGCNPSGNATLCDSAFVAPRFRIAQCRIPATT